MPLNRHQTSPTDPFLYNYIKNVHAHMHCMAVGGALNVMVIIGN